MGHRWLDFVEECRNCHACELSQSRTNVVIYRGSIDAPLMIVGEGPGANEDIQGMPFVGQAGRLLDLLLQSYGFSERNYHICNIVKCRPPGNRAPTIKEAKACMPLLSKQVRFVQPKLIMLLGKTAYKYFSGSNEGITKVRGRFYDKNGYLIMPTYHPAYILRNNNKRATLWEDIGYIRNQMEQMGLMQPLPHSPQMPQGRG